MIDAVLNKSARDGSNGVIPQCIGGEAERR